MGKVRFNKAPESKEIVQEPKVVVHHHSEPEVVTIYESNLDRVEALEARMAEIEARPVKKPMKQKVIVQEKVTIDNSYVDIRLEEVDNHLEALGVENDKAKDMILEENQTRLQQLLKLRITQTEMVGAINKMKDNQKKLEFKIMLAYGVIFLVGILTIIFN